MKNHTALQRAPCYTRQTPPSSIVWSTKMGYELIALLLLVRLSDQVQFDKFLTKEACFNTTLKKSKLWVVEAQILQVPIGPSHANQGQKFRVLQIFLDPGGQGNPLVRL